MPRKSPVRNAKGRREAFLTILVEATLPTQILCTLENDILLRKFGTKSILLGTEASRIQTNAELKRLG